MIPFLSSTRQLTDSTGTVTLAKSYDPYGTVTHTNGAAQSAYGFTGEMADVTKLTYLCARYYSLLDESSQTNTVTLMTDYLLVDALRMSS